MTTIAFDGQVVACDSRQTMGDVIFSDTAIKGKRLDDGTIIATCGDATCFAPAVAYVEGGCTDKALISGDFDGSFLVVRPDGTAALHYKNGMSCDVKPPCAIGSGGPLAMAAMKAGNNAAQAVHVACQLDVYSGGTIHAFFVSEKE